jgi:branched-chain amino acid transport system ATP-binding protein
VSLLEVQDVHTYYGDSYVLKGVNLKVEPGSVVAVLGRNGVGKTTLIRSIMGLTPARRGKILYQEKDITHLPTYRIARLGIGLVPQGRRVFSSLTTKENMTVAARGGGQLGWSVEKVAGRFPNLAARLQTRGVRLSGGEQQMLAFGRALVGNADLLLLDEPTEGLAPLLVAEIGNFIKEIREHGISILIVEQSLPFVLKIADLAYVMSKGVVVHESRPKELQENAEVKSRYLGI